MIKYITQFSAIIPTFKIRFIKNCRGIDMMAETPVDRISGAIMPTIKIRFIKNCRSIDCSVILYSSPRHFQEKKWLVRM